MDRIYIILNPCNNVILECAFDELMQDIGRDQLMDVGSGEILCEGL